MILELEKKVIFVLDGILKEQSSTTSTFKGSNKVQHFLQIFHILLMILHIKIESNFF